MIKILTPADESELAVARSILDSENIPYHIRNEHFGSLYVGVMIKNFNAKAVYVPEEFFEDARKLLSNFSNLHEKPAQIENRRNLLTDFILKILNIFR